MHQPALELARSAGVEVDMTGRVLHSHCSQWDIEVLLARSDDIPAWTQDGAVEMAIAGPNQIEETRSQVDVLAELGFGRCSLQVAVRDGDDITSVSQLDGRRIATSHPRDHPPLSGRVGHRAPRSPPSTARSSSRPRLDAADAIVDLVSTGDTLRANGLRPIATVLESEAVLLARTGLDDVQRAIADELATVIRSVVAARGRRYVMLNAPDGSLDNIIELLPGLDSPTVLPLAAEGMHAVHAVVPRDRVVDLLGPLRAAGARSILVLPDRQPHPMSVIRPELADAQPYRWQEGLPTDRPLYRFDMNTPPLPPEWYPRAQARLARVLVQSYPDATYTRLRALLSEYTGHPAHLIIPVAGADEAIYVLAQLTLRPGDRGYARRPRYSVYEMAVRLAGGTMADEPDGARLRFVCSPHNPTGADGDPTSSSSSAACSRSTRPTSSSAGSITRRSCASATTR